VRAASGAIALIFATNLNTGRYFGKSSHDIAVNGAYFIYCADEHFRCLHYQRGAVDRLLVSTADHDANKNVETKSKHLEDPPLCQEIDVAKYWHWIIR
jgi:hypothetical protein